MMLQLVKRSTPDREKKGLESLLAWVMSFFGVAIGGNYLLTGRYWIDGDLLDKEGVKILDGLLELSDWKHICYHDYEAAQAAYS